MDLNNSGFWDVAYRDNAPILLGVLRRYVKNSDIAQDLLHEVFITAIDKYGNYSGKGSFEGWLYKIAVNTALMHLRNERNNLVETLHVTSLYPAIDDDADDTLIDGTRATIEAAGFSGEELLSAIDRLPEHHKLVFNMYVMDDFSHRQIATELNISPGTSKSHLARARKKIQQILYNDAMNRKKKKDRRRASAFWLLFPAKEHYIDRLYRNGLSDFTIPPTGGAGFLSAALEQQAASVVSATAQSAASVVTQVTFWGSKLSYIAACCGTAAVTGGVCWLSMSVNSPLNRAYDAVSVSDTLMYAPNPTEETHTVFDADSLRTFPMLVTTENPDDPSDSVSSNEQVNLALPVEKTTAPVPVVVKKQIIQRQTVVVRDTVFIVE